MEYKNILLEKNYLNSEEAFKLLSMTLDQVNKHYLGGGLYIILNGMDYKSSENIVIKPFHIVRKFNKFLKKNDFEKEIKSIVILLDTNKKVFVVFDCVRDNLWTYEIVFYKTK